MTLDELDQESGPKFKWWHVLVVVFIGIGTLVLGILGKILSHPYADLTVVIASFTLVFSCFLAILKVIFFRSKNSKLNR